MERGRRCVQKKYILLHICPHADQIQPAVNNESNTIKNIALIGRGCHDYKYFMSANRQVLFVSTMNNLQIYKTTTNLKFHIVKGNEKDKYVK